jgi:hypothetical protein
MSQCSIENCERKHLAKGYCSAHYYELVDKYKKRTRVFKDICTIKDCSKPANYTQYGRTCAMHYQRIKLAKNPIDPNTLHHLHHGKANTPEWYCWTGLKSRCLNQNPIYGGRGITVCKRWQEKPYGFLNFLEDMGEKPEPTYSIDRIDVNGNYEPGNCRWASIHQQAWNKRNNKKNIGIYYYPRNQRKWVAMLRVNNKTAFYQAYFTKKEAISERAKVIRSLDL